jgi:hypothetical protein
MKLLTFILEGHSSWGSVVGWSCKPSKLMRSSDICEVKIENVGPLINPTATQG